MGAHRRLSKLAAPVISRPLALALIFAATVGQPMRGQSLESLRFQVDNDWFDFSMRSVDRPDDNYTHGQIARAVLNTAPKWALLGRPECAVARRATGKMPTCIQSTVAVVNQMYTPTDDSPFPVKGERPYAGILYVDYGRQSVSPRMLRSINGTVGTTGAISGAEWEQKLFHRLADLRKPEGWAHQISTYPVLGFNYGIEYLVNPPSAKRSFANVVAKSSLVANTIQVSGSAGTEVHLGFNVPHPWLPVGIESKRALSLYLIAGGNETWFARNLLLEGNSDETRGLVEMKRLVPGSILGAALGAGGIFLEYRFVGQGRDYLTGPAWHRWGAISIIVGNP